MSIASADPVAHSRSWLNLYQYKKTWNGHQSDVQVATFFFSPQGRTSPAAELAAARRAFARVDLPHGLMKLPAACAFPARKVILERLLNEKFPDVACPDLQDWLGRIQADRVSIVYAGAYSGNPASILGHTFLRFYGQNQQSAGRAGQDLLSYSVGFLANPDPRDSKLVYSVKGLTGRYPGFYDIEPYYMKVGLYNNAESRDLWEWPLDYSADEVQLILKYLWELSFNSEFKYFFLDENCSYRVLKLLDVAKPESNLTVGLPTVVLPAETVRRLDERGHIRGRVRYRSSIERRLSLKLDDMTSTQLKLYQKAKGSKSTVEQIQDPEILDALIDHWTYLNYKKRTRLSSDESEQMEAAFSKRAQIPTASKVDWDHEAIRRHFALTAPLQGHRNSWFETYYLRHGHQEGLGFSYRPGTHTLWQDETGFDDVARIEYAGLNLEYETRGTWLWEFLLGRAYSLSDILGVIPRPSWQFDIRAANSCLLCDQEQIRGLFSVAGGVSTHIKSVRTYAMASLQAQTWLDKTAQGLIAPGVLLGAKLPVKYLNIWLEHNLHWWRRQAAHQLSAQMTYHWQKNRDLFVKGGWDDWQQGRSETLLRVGGAFFF
ncbi:MAG: DUF4105 domain-containing protein [Bdellovibrionales bacterium]